MNGMWLMDRKPANRSPEYTAWRNMIDRCKRPHPHDNCYNKDISVHESWTGERGFVNFLSCVGKRPRGYCLGRLDKQQDYQPGNVEWMPWRENNLRRVTPFKHKKGYKLYAVEKI